MWGHHVSAMRAMSSELRVGLGSERWPDRRLRVASVDGPQSMQQPTAVSDLNGQAGAHIGFEYHWPALFVQHEIDADIAQFQLSCQAYRGTQQIGPIRDCQPSDRREGVRMDIDERRRDWHTPPVVRPLCSSIPAATRADADWLGHAEALVGRRTIAMAGTFRYTTTRMSGVPPTATWASTAWRWTRSNHRAVWKTAQRV